MEDVPGLPAHELPGLAAQRLRELTSASWDIAAVLDSTGSTNDDAARLDPPGATDGSRLLGRVVVADHQSSGRGRLGRSWSAPPRTSVAVSVVLRPPVPPAAWGWLPLLAGQAARDCVARLLPTGVQARVKWPNDVVVRGSGVDGKICGLLTEVRGRDVVIGAGLNTNLATDQLPVATATSLRLVTGRIADPTEMVASYLEQLASWWRAWTAADGDAAASGLYGGHRRWSDTVGRTVAVTVPGGGVVRGVVADVAADGRLEVDAGAGGTVTIGAGDVVTVR